MALASLFADRLHYYNELPFLEAHKLFEAPITKYVSPPVDVETHDAPSPTGAVPVLTYRPTGSVGNLPVLIWMHGGGFQMGTYTMNEGDIVAREMSHRANMVVVNVEYRLVTDKVKFPAPQDDCMAALDWVVANIEKLGARRDAIFVGGISAGGALAASMIVLDRDNGNTHIAGALLNCPVAHFSLPALSEELQSKVDEINGFGLTAQIIDDTRKFALGDQTFNPVWFAGEVKDLSNLPPTQIINCEYDALRASGEKFGEQLSAAGVKVETLTQAGVPHAHINRYPADCKEMVETLDEMVRFVNEVARKN
jgi:acetyl esterase/lipase